MNNKWLQFFLTGQVPPHVTPQVQGLSSGITNIQPGLVPPPSVPAAPPAVVEDNQQPLEECPAEAPLDNSYHDQVQEQELEPQEVAQEPGKRSVHFVMAWFAFW